MTLPQTLLGLLDRAVQLWPHRVGWVFDEQDETLTFAAIDARSDALARLLIDSGVRSGDHVAVMLRNSPAFPLAWIAIAKVGAAIVPINTNYRSYDATHILKHSGAQLVFTSSDFADLLDDIAPETELERVVVLDAFDYERPGPALPDIAVGPESICNIQYTSGTTGAPKGCMLPHAYWSTLAGGLVEGFPYLTDADVILTAQPFHYIDPQWNVALGMASGAKLVVLDRFHPSTFWSKICDYGVTWFYCLGMMPKLLLDAPVDDRPHQVRAVCASAIPPELHRPLEARWAAPWFEAFGMTETGSDIRMDPRDHDSCVGTGCLGRPVLGREARIVDDRDQPVPAGTTGQLLVRGDGMMHAYFRDPEATAAVFRGGWMHTGDLGSMDTEGRVYYRGRTKDMIRRSGENISALEVERVLLKHPAVAVAAVLSEPDDVRGEEVHAVLVAARGHGPQDLTQLIEYCQEQLAYFKVPRYWTFVGAVPTTPSERVAKPELRAQIDADAHRSTFDRSAGA